MKHTALVPAAALLLTAVLGTGFPGLPASTLSAAVPPAGQPAPPPADSRDHPAAMVGTWRFRGDGVTLSLTLAADGRHELVGDGPRGRTSLKGGWIHHDGVLQLKSGDADTVSYKLVMDGGKMRLSGGDLPAGQELVLERSEAVTGGGLGAVLGGAPAVKLDPWIGLWSYREGESSLALLLLPGGEMHAEVRGAAGKQDIAGKWIIAADVLTLQSAAEKLEFRFAVAGDKLTLRSDKVVELRLAEGSRERIAAAMTAARPPADPSALPKVAPPVEPGTRPAPDPATPAVPVPAADPAVAPLVGRWHWNDEYQKLAFTVLPEGLYHMRAVSFNVDLGTEVGRLTVKDGRLTLSRPGGTVTTYDVRIADGRAHFSGGDLKEPRSFAFEAGSDAAVVREARAAAEAEEVENRKWRERLPLGTLGADRAPHVPLGADLPADPKFANHFPGATVYAGQACYIWMGSMSTAYDAAGRTLGNVQPRMTYWFLPNGRVFIKNITFRPGRGLQGDVTTFWGRYRLDGTSVHVETDAGEKMELKSSLGRRRLTSPSLTFDEVNWVLEEVNKRK